MSSSKRLTGLKVAGLCGVMGPVIVITFIFLAISYSPWFSWTENDLSNLGVEGIAAILFNSSLIGGGLLSLIFAIGLRKILMGRTLGHAGTLILILASANLCAIGIFPETAGFPTLLRFGSPFHIAPHIAVPHRSRNGTGVV